MNYHDPDHKLSDLIAFLVEQYGFRRACYARKEDGVFRTSVVMPVRILSAEAASMLEGRRFRLHTEEALRQAQARLTFVVRDTGPGIPAADQKRIFESFSQVDASISRKSGGTGLGLAISRMLAEQMGGWLHVESQAEGGASFHFTIPAELSR